jgi:O-antigen/teichoic acid export membrane protein
VRPSVTTRREKLLVLKNAAANLVRGGASAVVALVLPPFLTRSMSRDAFGAWALILQLSAYVSYLDFGIQTAVARFVAHATERNDARHRDGIVSTAVATLAASGCAAFLSLVLLALFLSRLFHHLPGSLLFDVRLALLLVGGSLCIGLPASVFAGIFVGLQHNEVPAAIIGASRLLSAALLILIVRNGGGIVAMSIAVAIVNISSYGLQFKVYRRFVGRLTPTISLSVGRVTKAAAWELFDYCASLTIWGLGMVLVTGLDLTIVGVYRFYEVGYYAVAATLVTFLVGVFGALFGAMGSPTAVLHARGDSDGLGRMVSATTRLGMLLLLATGIPLIFGAGHILRLWVGPVYAQHATLLVQILVAANIVRLCVGPYIIAMIGAGEQRRIILVPLLEGAANLLGSLIAGYYLGAVGVAIGTLIGSFVSLGGHFVYTIRRNAAMHLTAIEYFRDSLLPPLLCCGPVLILGVLWLPLLSFLPYWLLGFLLAAASILSLVLVWYVGLIPNERQKLVAEAKLTLFSMSRSHDPLKAK